MNYFLAASLFAAALATSVTGCKLSELKTGAERPALAVNGAAITEGEIGMKIQQMAGHEKAVNHELRDYAEQELIDLELLYQRGVELGIDRDEKFRQAVRLMEYRVREFKRTEMARRVRNTQVAAAVRISTEDVRKYYEQKRSNITTDLHLLLMRFPDQAKARDAHRKVMEGAAFEAVAALTSPAAGHGNPHHGDLGFLHWNEIPVEIADAVYELKDQEISGILGRTKTGFFIVKVASRKTNTDATFESMSTSIMNRLRDIRLREAQDQYLASLRKEAKIVKMQ